MAADYLAIVVVILAGQWFRTDILPLFFAMPEFPDIPGIYPFLMVPLTFMLFIHFSGLYKQRLLFWQQAEKLFKVTIYAMVCILSITYFTGDVKGISRVLIGFVWLFSFPCLLIFRQIIKKLMIAVGLWQIPVVLIGAGKTAELLLSAFYRDAGLGYKIVGVIEDNPLHNAVLEKYPIVGTFEKAEDAVIAAGVRDVLIAAPGLNRDELLSMIYRLQPYVKNITFVPDLFGVPVRSMELQTLFNEKAVMLTVRNNLAQDYNRILKRMFDFFASLMGMIALSPFLLLLGVLVYLDSPGPVFFSHRRIGQNGVYFNCYKFRTMIVNAEAVLEHYLSANPAAREEWNRDFKLKEDPRISKLGAFLRRSSLDELPQLVNVFKGEMSLVGPRPIVREEIRKYGNYIFDYYLVRPGITGFWQINGRNDVDYDERVRMDSWYVRNWSFWLDIMLLFKTVRAVFSRKGAY